MENTIEEKKNAEVEMIRQILEEQRPYIMERVKEDLKKQVINSLTYAAQNAITSAASKFVEEEMKTDLQNLVIELKGTLLDEIRAQMPKIAAEFGSMLLKTATKNFQADSWKTQELMKKIFE